MNKMLTEVYNSQNLGQTGITTKQHVFFFIAIAAKCNTSITLNPRFTPSSCILKRTVATVIHFTQLVTSRSALYTGF